MITVSKSHLSGYVLAFGVIASSALAELSPQHMRLMQDVAAAAQDCVEAEFTGPICDRADALLAQSTALGICWEVESNPYYCEASSVAASSGDFAFDDAAVRVQFNRLSDMERIRMQDVMNSLGYYTAAFDGLYGPGTSRAIRKTLEELVQSQGTPVDMSHVDGIRKGFDLILSQPAVR
jgi:hypothetical protein